MKLIVIYDYTGRREWLACKLPLCSAKRWASTRLRPGQGAFIEDRNGSLLAKRCPHQPEWAEITNA